MSRPGVPGGGAVGDLFAAIAAGGGATELCDEDRVLFSSIPWVLARQKQVAKSRT